MVDLSYKDRREDDFRKEFSDIRIRQGTVEITEESSTANGRPIRKIDTEDCLLYTSPSPRDS